METQQEIALHEQELSSLLSRVLEHPLTPLRQALDDSRRQLDALEADVCELREIDITSIKIQLGDDLKSFERRIKSLTENSRKETETKIAGVLAECRKDLVATQGDALRSLGEDLRQNWVVQGELLTQNLTDQLQLRGEQQKQTALNIRDDLASQAVQVQKICEEEAGRRMAEVLKKINELTETVSGIGISAEKTLSVLSRGQGHLVRLYEESQLHAPGVIEAALRPVRYMLGAVLVIATVSLATLAAVAIHW